MLQGRTASEVLVDALIDQSKMSGDFVGFAIV